MDINPDLQQLAFLLGTWRGEGKGSYPTIEPFSYVEEVTFDHVGKPFLTYAQRTHHPAKGFPMHAEAGYWRSVAPGRVEVVLAHPFGIVEIQEGTVEGGRVALASKAVVSTSTAKEVTQLSRTFVVEGDRLSYEVHMSAVGEPLQLHLTATLERVS